MAGGIRESSGGFGDDLPDNHEINVTPFIDVMLVLLIIFMVAAPSATVDVNIDLPVSNATPAQRPDQPVYLTIQPDLTLNSGNDPVAEGALQAALDRATGGNREQRIFLRADKVVAYGDVMDTMNEMRSAGYLKIALIGLEAAPGEQVAPPAATPEAAGAGQ
ncbi:TonB system transport protein ExbD [Paracoccus sp. DMF-8]|uniref:TonB system transport protein ExbD n=1 Tax=Paracoccus sp. DMF-8 TaxID=3019445 RepID=UPI0023E79584|nr:TonB system transport protein ExbD [Paracoccus sp. DMF-8]MDF3604836.1 TonB system transport protein ExbD [Paracoccus sp. DMF-8]